MGHTIYLDTTIEQLFEKGLIDRTVLKACQSARPPMLTAGDILTHLQDRGNFADVPGCRRPGRIPEKLLHISHMVEPVLTPSEMRPTLMKRAIAGRLDQDAGFEFLTPTQRAEVLDFRAKYGHLPMFLVLKYFLTRPNATRNDQIMASVLGFDSTSQSGYSFAGIGQNVNLSRERVRQIAQTYTLPEQLALPALWKQYADHSTYYADHTCKAFGTAKAEVPDLTFAAFATVLHRTTMLENVEDRYLARRGWSKEISAWVKRLRRLAQMPRAIDNRISIEGLAMGGTLDIRISLVVLHQIAPAMGLVADPPDALILPKNHVE